MIYGDDITEDDNLQKSGNKIVNARASDNMVVLHSTCSVEYSGTAKSKIQVGNRIIIIKPDNSLLIHSSEGIKPINWQKSSRELDIALEENLLKISSTKGDEELIIKCFKIHKSIHYKPPEEDDKSLVGTENDMHESIIRNPEIVEKGLHSLEHEKEISSGVIDIYGLDNENNKVIIEVKRKKAQLNHIDQLQRYVRTVEKDNKFVRGILVAPDISKSAESELDERNLEFVTLNPLDVISD